MGLVDTAEDVLPDTILRKDFLTVRELTVPREIQHAREIFMIREMAFKQHRSGNGLFDKNRQIQKRPTTIIFPSSEPHNCLPRPPRYNPSYT